ncbi:hypothetical protein [Corynebacterium sp. HS2168-gen11]|uniref:hypothetical protein n=1 Tax=Corynebacterium sp. HS2168-gen11 TaxID=2974027 RepID=UPI00216B1AC5|nr:hypothetical protein [Corynebacterium sp. HS2168-gen11]MCS4536028.1 hypothetical protein [Corynebacterium sp. HS2168-gen11]
MSENSQFRNNQISPLPKGQYAQRCCFVPSCSTRLARGCSTSSGYLASYTGKILHAMRVCSSEVCPNRRLVCACVVASCLTTLRCRPHVAAALPRSFKVSRCALLVAQLQPVRARAPHNFSHRATSAPDSLNHPATRPAKLQKKFLCKGFAKELFIQTYL